MLLDILKTFSDDLIPIVQEWGYTKFYDCGSNHMFKVYSIRLEMNLAVFPWNMDMRERMLLPMPLV